MRHYQKFQIQQLRARNLAATLETILAFLAALFITALLPSLLVRYLYSADQMMTEQPVILEYIPVVSFIFAVGYLVFTVIGNIRREKLAKKLESQLAMMDMDSDGCCGGHHHSDSDVSETEMRELEDIVDSALNSKSGKSATSTKSSSAKKSATRKKSK